MEWECLGSSLPDSSLAVNSMRLLLYLRCALVGFRACVGGIQPAVEDLNREFLADKASIRVHRFEDFLPIAIVIFQTVRDKWASFDCGLYQTMRNPCVTHQTYKDFLLLILGKGRFGSFHSAIIQLGLRQRNRPLVLAFAGGK